MFFQAKGKGPSVPWVEKYRPATIEDVAHQEQVVDTLRNALATGNVRISCNAVLSRVFPGNYRIIVDVCSRAASALAVLRASRHRQDVNDPCFGQGSVWT